MRTRWDDRRMAPFARAAKAEWEAAHPEETADGLRARLGRLTSELAALTLPEAHADRVLAAAEVDRATRTMRALDEGFCKAEAAKRALDDAEGALAHARATGGQSLAGVPIAKRPVRAGGDDR